VLFGEVLLLLIFFTPWTLDRTISGAHEIIEPGRDLELPVRGSVGGNSQGWFELDGTRRTTTNGNAACWVDLGPLVEARR
jgi:hypothetical protein